MSLTLASLLGSKSPPLVGLDISTSGVRLVELAEAGKGELRLERYASESLPRGALEPGKCILLEADPIGSRREVANSVAARLI